MKFLILILFLCLTSCKSQLEKTADEVQSWVLLNVPYTETEKCGHRALVAKTMLEELNYSVDYTCQKVKENCENIADCYHAFLRWSKNDESGELFKL